MKTLIALTLVTVLAAGCTSETSEKSDEPVSSAEDVQPAITELPRNCEGIGAARTEITFIEKGRLFSSRPNGSRVRCLVKAREGQDLRWGPAADRAFLFTSLGGRMLLPDLERTDRLDYIPQAIPQGWSRPQGTAFLWVSPDNTELVKVDAATGDVTNVTFLARTDEAIYHPAGEHILAVGEDDEGRYGIFMATNEGTEPQLLVLSEDAKRIYSMSFGRSGSLFYAAEHETHYDAHEVTFGQMGDTGEIQTELKTLYSSPHPISKVVVSPFENRPPVAIQVGTEDGNSCPSRTLIWTKKLGAVSFRDMSDAKRANIYGDVDDPVLSDKLDESSTEPIGWLPRGQLVVRTLGEDCDSTEGVYEWSPLTPKLLLEGARAVAVRAPYPEPPPPPEQELEVVA